MWNKLFDILQQPATKRLGVAIVISVVLHSILFGNMRSFLPTIMQDMHLIEARIQMPKPVTPKVGPLKPETPLEKLPVEKITVPQLEPKSEPMAEAPPEAKTEAHSEPVPPENTAGTELSPMSADTISNSIDISNPLPSAATEPQPEDSGLIVNENTYQYVETEFELRTEIDGKAQGKAKITYNLLDGKQYQIKWLTQGRGVVALLFPDLLQTSDGELTKAGLRPNNYLYQFGNKVDKNRAASFDWQTKKVTLTTSKGAKTEDLPEGAQDLLSFMYQFMHVAPLQHMQLAIVNGKKLRMYDYSFEGEEQINSALGELKTIHILHNGNDDEKTELWLAIDYQFVPVKIRKIENTGKVVEMAATRITTNRPVVNP